MRNLIDATAILDEVRYVKSEEEIDALAKSKEINELAIQAEIEAAQGWRQGLGGLGGGALRDDPQRLRAAGALFLGVRQKSEANSDTAEHAPARAR